MLRILMVAALALVAMPAAAQYTSFLLINGMAYPIGQVAISEADMNMWGPNLLRPPPIKGGERRQVTFNAPTTFCQADLRVEFADGGQPAIWEDLNICTLSKIKLQYDRMSGVTTASYDD